MRIELLIASFVVMIVGLIISGMIGSLILAVGIMLFLYTVFSREEAREAGPAKYVEPDYYQEPPHQDKKQTRPTEYQEEPKPTRKRNVDRAEKELRAWSPGKRGKRCPNCGSTSNPSDARFCADCGSKI
jgi:hypothetical protein